MYKLKATKFGWMTPKGSVKACSQWNHFDTLLDLLEENKNTAGIKQEYLEFKEGQQEDRDLEYDRRVDDDNDDERYGWHNYDYYDDVEDSNKRQSIVDNAYKLGYLRLGIVNDLLVVEGHEEGLRRNRKNIKDLCIETSSELDCNLFVKEEIVRCTKETNNELLDILRKEENFRRNKLTLIKDKGKKTNLSKIFKIFPKCNINKLVELSEEKDFTKAFENINMNDVNRINKTLTNQEKLSLVEIIVTKDPIYSEVFKTLKCDYKIKDLSSLIANYKSINTSSMSI